MPQLTNRIVQQLTPEYKDRATLVWDDKLPGFGVRVQPSGQKSYFLQYRYRGRSRRRTIGHCEVMKAHQARKMGLQALSPVSVRLAGFREKRYRGL
jgi:hypothetical protein